MNALAAVGAVAAGGAIGSVLRYLVSTFFLERFGPGFPWGTFTINVSGAFLIGVVFELATTRSGFDVNARLFLTSGFLGGYTTFSAFAYELYLLGAGTLSLLGIAYAVGSVVLGLLATIAGVGLVRAFAS